MSSFSTWVRRSVVTGYADHWRVREGERRGGGMKPYLLLLSAEWRLLLQLLVLLWHCCYNSVGPSGSSHISRFPESQAWCPIIPPPPQPDTLLRGQDQSFFHSLLSRYTAGCGTTLPISCGLAGTVQGCMCHGKDCLGQGVSLACNQ